MATLRDYFVNHPEGWTLPGIVETYKLRTFFETGTGYGESVEYARDHFTWTMSMECYPEIYEKARDRFRDFPRVIIIQGDTSRDLMNILYKRAVRDYTLFFLDAHFPGADFHYTKYDDEQDPHRRVPLLKEVDQIIKIKDTRKDVFVIDDLWLFEKGDFSAGPCPVPDELLPKGVIDWIVQRFEKTHIVIRDYRFQGFLVILPKQ